MVALQGLVPDLGQGSELLPGLYFYHPDGEIISLKEGGQP